MTSSPDEKENLHEIRLGTTESLKAKDDEKEKEKNDKEKEEEKIPDKGGLMRLNREHAPKNKFLLINGWIWAFCNGAVMPFFAVIFREILDFLNEWYEAEAKGEHYDLNAAAIRGLLYFFGVGFAAFIFTTLQYGFWGTYGSRVAVEVRKTYLTAALQQDIAYHDKETAAKLNNGIVTDCQAIQDGISVKLGFFLQQTSAFIVGMIWAFYYSWQLTLILMACVPVMAIVGWLQGKMIQGAAGANVDPFAVKGGSVSQEVLTNIRIVLSFPNMVKIKIQEYAEVLAIATPKAIRTHVATGIGIGFFMFALFSIMYPLTLYVGAGMVDDGTITIGEMFGAYFSFFIAGMGLGQLGSVLGDIKKGGIGANKMYALLDRQPQIRPADGNTVTNVKICGKIEFKNVSFAYPANPDRIVLKNLTFKVEPGQSLALVGPSGSGKSTVVALLERFFDPLEGEILIDDVPIHNYDINHLRSQIGLVSQMPLLFDATITDNIRGGMEEKKMEEIERAAKLANAHDFITQLLEKGYNTKVGELGGKLSGGQRQRIAIARAVLLGPSVLLLDEATSALDTKSEREVQEALDKIKRELKQTTVTIAHRLSTIQNSNKILVLVDGEMVEQGSHLELLQKNGVYAILCQSQKLLEDKTILHKQTSKGSPRMTPHMSPQMGSHMSPHMSPQMGSRSAGQFPRVVSNEHFHD